jgi:Thioesterase domain
MSASLMSGGLRRSAVRQRQAQSMRRIAAHAFFIVALGIGPAAAAQTAKPVAHAAPAHAGAAHSASRDDGSHPHVYLMRGLLNIFSLGMDQLAAQIARNSIDASVYNHSAEETVVRAIVQKYRGGDHGPYILVGHSLGADAVMLMAQQLNAQGVPVALVVPFDGTGSYAAPANVNCVFNLTQRNYAYMQAGAGFHGKLSNVDVSSDTSIDHVTIDKSPRLQAMALKEILQAARGQSCRPGTNPPALARAKQSAPVPPADTGSNENATKATAPTIPANSAAPAKAASPGIGVARPKTAAPAKPAVPAKSAAPSAPPKSATPAPSGAPEKSAAAAHAS